MKSVAFIIVAVAAIGCRTQSEPYRFSGGDGSTRQRAIIVKARDAGIGVAAKMIWMNERYPGWREVTNYSARVDGRWYHDVVVTRDGQTNRIYFDYTDFAPRD
jgi:hypothetical protein